MHLVLCVLLVLVTGCGELPVEPPPSADAGTEAPDAGAAPECPAGSHAVEGGCDATMTWSTGPALPLARDHHVTLVTTGGERAWLYVLGGSPDRVNSLDSTFRAPLGQTGNPGAWEEGEPLPRPMSGHSLAQLGAYVVVASGTEAPLRLSTRTHVAKTEADGRLRTWREGPALPAARFHHAAAVHGRTVFVTGGLHTVGPDADNAADVFAADLDESGTLGPWRTLRALPDKRSHHAAIASGGGLYVLGGLRGNPSAAHVTLDDVLRADILPDGNLGEWRKVSTLPRAVTTHAVFEHVGRLWIVGGIEAMHDFTGNVRRAPLLPDGGLGPWTSAAPLPVARGHVHQTPRFGDRVYSVAGANAGMKSIADVAVGMLE
ncbi:MAG: hypothetical protein ACK4N5_08340 [Myxococcales bacterium]